MGGLLVRKNIRSLSDCELDHLVRAFHAIQSLPPTDPDSFFYIAAFHGEPFRGAGWGNSAWWGKYCNHGNVFFPTWHRAHVHRLELALQKQVPGVALPYWNEIEEATMHWEGIPLVLTQRDYHFSDGSGSIPNPLCSYTFQRRVADHLGPNFPDADYSKPKGHTTTRLPFAVLVGAAANIQATVEHNNRMEALDRDKMDKMDKMLNDNVQMWLNDEAFVDTKGETITAGVGQNFINCLQAPNYTVFSNTTSQTAWNDEHADDTDFVAATSVESPHNAIQLAVGGIDIPSISRDLPGLAGANGDMGENDTASFDPIFFFHHCFIDLVFWHWQTGHGAIRRLEVIPGYPGTNSVDSQGPTPGVAGGTWLSLDSPLPPIRNFKDPSKPLASRDVVNIEAMGYTYKVPNRLIMAPHPQPAAPILATGGVNRGAIAGSFVVSAWAVDEKGKEQLVGAEPVPSRWHISGCSNCQNHLEARAHFPLTGWIREDAEKTKFVARVHTRADARNQRRPGMGMDMEDGMDAVAGVDRLSVSLSGQVI